MLINGFFDKSKYIIAQGERIFLDICEKGCGSGCIYCYAPNHKEKQKLLNKRKISAICKYVKSNYNFNKKIISLCPNTEPLKSKKSRKLILYIIKFFSDENSYIQISTKEKIPESYLKKIDDLVKSKVYINISIPTISGSDMLEPNAASVEQRFSNFAKQEKYKHINLCLYIKPFILKKQDYDLYIEYINRYHINTVFVGPTFNLDSDIPCISLYNKEKAKRMYSTQLEAMNEFTEVLRKNTKAKVFGSSVCGIYNDHYDSCSLELFNYGDKVCNDCKLQRSLCLYG